MGYTICMLEDISIEFYAALFINKAVYHLQSPGLYHIQRGSSRPPIDGYSTYIRYGFARQNLNIKLTLFMYCYPGGILMPFMHDIY